MTDHDDPKRLAAEAALAERTRIIALGLRLLGQLQEQARTNNFTVRCEAKAAASAVEDFIEAIEAGKHHDRAGGT